MNVKFVYPDQNEIIIRDRLKMGNPKYGVTNRYFTKDGVPFFPVMTEMHFSRYDCDKWEEEICKLKACGADIISTYMFWNHHEEEEGVFDFTGDRDLRRFVRLCGKHGLLVWVRPGPWCHGEARLGGFPDWLIEKCPVRCNDEVYLGYVKRLFENYAHELRGLLARDGGPVIGLQLDNELTNNAEHLAALKRIAMECGLDLPYYSVTGWAGNGTADFPRFEAIPFFGSYPEAPWDNDSDPIEGSPCCLPVPGRSDGTIGSDQIMGAGASEDEELLENYPYVTCETGPGVQITHHRRPVISPMDVYSMSMTQIGKGSSLIGYYVFHGGRNPEGKTCFYQESRDTGYPNDLPVRSYDFQAPIDEYGVPRMSYDYFNLLHMFLHSEEQALLRGRPTFSSVKLTGRRDTHTPRAILRADMNGSGFLFLNTYQRLLSLAPLKSFSADIVSEAGKNKLTFPREPIDIPSGVSAVFPIRFEIGGTKFDYATAQPITTVEVCGKKLAFFAAIDGVRAEFAFSDGRTLKLMPGRSPAFTVSGTDVYLLSFADALRLNVLGERVFLTDDHMYEDENGIVEYGDFRGMSLSLDPIRGEFVKIDAPKCEFSADIGLEEISARDIKQKDSPFIRYLFSPLSDCKAYKLKIPKNIFEECDDLLLRFSVHGDVGEIFCGDRMPIDFYANGEETTIAASRIRPFIESGEDIILVLSPLSDKKVYLERYISRGKCCAELTETLPLFRRRID